MKFLKNIGKKLFLKYADQTEKDLMIEEFIYRHDPEFIKLFKQPAVDYQRLVAVLLKDKSLNIVKDKPQVFYDECHLLRENATLQAVADELLNDYKEYVIYQSQERDINFFRGKIAGNSELIEKLKLYSTQSIKSINEQNEDEID